MQQSDYLKLHYINVKPHEFKFDNNVLFDMGKTNSILHKAC